MVDNLKRDRTSLKFRRTGLPGFMFILPLHRCVHMSLPFEHMKRAAIITSFVVLSCALRGHAQDTTRFTKLQIDTFHLTNKMFKRTVAFTFRSVVFYVNFYDFKKLVEDKLRGENIYQEATYRATWDKLMRDIEKCDTVFLTQATFDSAQIIPFDDFLIRQIENDKCVIRDLDKNLQPVIIREKGVKYYHPGIWGGRLFFLPGSRDKFFIETTDIIS